MSTKVDSVNAFSVQGGTELWHPVQAAYLAVPRREFSTVVWDLEEPSVPGEAVVPKQPLVDDPSITIDVPQC